jgi:hypothetical protein
MVLDWLYRVILNNKSSQWCTVLEDFPSIGAHKERFPPLDSMVIELKE